MIWRVLLIALLVTSTATAQEGDRWFIIDKFSGLNLYLDDASLPKGAMLEAENVQFRHPGKFSALEGLTSRAQVDSGYAIQGIGSLREFVNDSARIVAVCSLRAWNTWGDTFAIQQGWASREEGNWQHHADSYFVEETTTVAVERAAEFWRPGWLWYTAYLSGEPIDTNEYWDKIDYITDNGMVYLETTIEAAQITGGSLTKAAVIPQWPDSNADVQIVPIEVDGKAMAVILQAGAEPVLYNGASQYGYRYFGVADSGIVATLDTVDQSGLSMVRQNYIEDNDKLGLYDDHEMGPDSAAYWIHFPYAAGRKDTTLRRIIDSGESDTSLISSGLSTPDSGFWIGGYIKIIDGVRAGDSSTITDFWSSNDSLAFEALGGTPGVGDSFLVFKQIRWESAGPDSTIWGRCYRIDSNKTVISDSSAYFRIFFRPHTDFPYGDLSTWQAQIQGTNYQILSAPFLHDAFVGTDSIDSIRMAWGGHYVAIGDTTIGFDVRGHDHVPHMLFVQDRDTVGGKLYYVPGLGYAKGYPISTAYNDTASGMRPGSTVVLMSGRTSTSGAAVTWHQKWKTARLGLPDASAGIVYKDRLYLAGDPEDPNLICYSEPFEMGAFPARNFVSVGGNGDEFVGFALIYEWLVIFQRHHTWLLKDDIDLGGTLVLALPDEGCVAQNSIVELENRVLYRSAKGWRLFDGNTAQDFALPIKPGVQAFPRSDYSVNQAYRHKAAAGYDPQTGNVWMSEPFGSDTANSGSWLYNFVDGSFSYSDEVYGRHVVNMEFKDTTWLVFTSTDEASRIYTHGRTDSLTPVGIDGDSMMCKVSTGWMDFDAPSMRKAWDIGFLTGRYAANSTVSANHKMYLNFYRDYDSVALLSDTTSIGTVVGTTYYEAQYNQTFVPPADGADFQFLRVEVIAYGFTTFRPLRLGIRYSTDPGVVPYDGDVRFIRP